MRFDNVMTKMFLALAVLAGCSFSVAVAQQDWTQWRGPKLDSVAEGQTVVSKLDESTKLWRTEMPGVAGSSPIVVGDRVFATSVDGDSLVVLCLNAESGKLLWQKTVEGRNENNRDSANSASSSPSSDGKHVWTMFGNGQVDCFTVEGEKVWSKNLQEHYGAFNIQFGMSTTPILHDGQLIFGLMHGKMRDRSTSNGILVSLDAETGKETWKHIRKTDATIENKHVYASPCIAEVDGRATLIIHGADYTTGHKIDSGEELWRLGGMNPKGDAYLQTLRFVSSAVCRDGMVVIPSAKRRAVWAVKADQDGKLNKNDLAWASPRITPDVATPIIYNGFVFLARENGVMACLEATTGKKLVEKRYMADKHRSTPVAVDGKLVVTDRSGKVILVKADESLKEISSIELGEETTASPAVSSGKIFVRTFEAIYAFGEK